MQYTKYRNYSTCYGGEHQKLKFHIGVSIATDKEIPQNHEHGKWSTRIEHFYNHACIARASIKEKNNEFKIYLQAKYSPSGEKLMGAEALVRWVNNENGVITPDSFIPIFEQNGFITKLDDYMISGVAGLIADWISMGKEVVTISVNVSRAHFVDPNLAKQKCDMIQGYFFAKPEPVKEFESRHLQKIQKI